MMPLADGNAACSSCCVSADTFPRCPHEACSPARKRFQRVSLLNSRPWKLDPWRSHVAASSRTFLWDFYSSRKCSYRVTSSLSIRNRRAVSNVDPKCSVGAFAANKSTPQYPVSFEEVQLPPIPRVFSPLKDLVPRAFDKVRSKEGLAYSVYGGWTPSAEHRGSFLAGGETQINTVPQFIRSVEKVLQGVTVQAPSEEDLAKAKEGIINSFVFNFVDSGVQLSRLMTYELFGIDQNFLFNYKKKVEKLTKEDIIEAAKRRLHPGIQPVLVVADAAKVMPALKTMGRKIILLHPEYLP